MWHTRTIAEQLPHGVGNNAIAPHAFARSAIFSTQNFKGHGRPFYAQRKELAALNSMNINQLYGHQLDQHDADVMFELLRRVFAQGDSNKREARVLCKRLDLLRALGRAPGGKSRKLLDESIDRLTMATYEFQIPGLMTGMSRLILKALKRDRGEIEDAGADGPDYDILLDLELAKLFQYQEWVLLSKTERDRLLDDPLARGLHTYYSTHEKPFPVLPSTLKSLAGRETMREDKWISALVASLKNLKTATGWPVCELATTGKNAGKVVVQKVKAKKAATKPALKAEDAPPPAAVPMDLTRFKRADLYALSQAEAEALMPASMRAAWQASLTNDPDIACDPGSWQIRAVMKVISLWEEEQKRINPQIAAELNDI